MKKSPLAALALAGLLALAGCQTGEAPGRPSSALAPEPQSSSAPAPGPSSSSAPAALPIPGIDAGHYPSINGSTANHPLISRLYAELCGIPREDAETLVDLDLGSTGSIWVRALTGGGPDVLIAYEPPEDVKEEYKEQFKDFEISPLGRDGLVFLVNAKNPVDDVTVDELRRIYTGELTDWSQVGGEAGEIKPFQRNADSGSQTLFLKLLMPGLTPMNPPTELVQGSMGGLIDGVASFDGSGGALGYSVYYYASLMYQNPDLKLLSVDGVAPSAASIGDKSYPLTNDFYVAIRADEPEGSPARLVRDWLLSPEGERILTEENYVYAAG